MKDIEPAKTTRGSSITEIHSMFGHKLYFGATDVTATLRFDDPPSVHPGDRATVAFELHRPIAVETGMRFAMREGGRTVGAGVVSAVM